MEKNLWTVTEQRIRKTMAALEKNNMEAMLVTSREELLEKLGGLVPAGSTVASGGSMTLAQLGLMDWLRDGHLNYLDRSRPGITPEEADQIQRQAFSADFYFTGSNAVTEQGELYNIDGIGNRVAAIAFGPKRVLVLVGYNKIVKDMSAAMERLEAVAAPANAQRLSTTTTGCYTTGHCTGGCRSEQRLCCQYLKTGYQRQKGRITVIFMPETLGY